MTLTRVAVAAVLGLLVLPLVGCAGGAADPEPRSILDEATGLPTGFPAAPDPFGCGITVTPAIAVVGQDVLVSRAPVSPGDTCTTLAPGTIQTIELRSSYGNDVARQTAPATVAADGSFAATMTVPVGIRLGQGQVTVIPPAESDCTAAATAAGTPDDCHFPGTAFTAHFAPESLTALRTVTTDVELPTFDAGVQPADSYAVAGPGAHELTLMIFGSGCASRPTMYRHTAPAGSLEIVSETIVPAGSDGCTAQLKLWTTVIEIPDAYRDYRRVSVDNLETTLVNR